MSSEVRACNCSPHAETQTSTDEEASEPRYRAVSRQYADTTHKLYTLKKSVTKVPKDEPFKQNAKRDATVTVTQKPQIRMSFKLQIWALKKPPALLICNATSRYWVSLPHCMLSV